MKTKIRTKPNTKSELIQVKKALSNPDYKWRTVEGIAQEVSLSEDRVKQALVKLIEQGLVIQNSKNANLIATPKQYYRSRSIGRRILSVLSDKIR